MACRFHSQCWRLFGDSVCYTTRAVTKEIGKGQLHPVVSGIISIRSNNEKTGHFWYLKWALLGRPLCVEEDPLSEKILSLPRILKPLHHLSEFTNLNKR